VAAACGALLLLAGPAVAGGRMCRQLEAELASLGSGSGSGNAGKYDRLVAAQENQISAARSRARRAGCGFSFLSNGPKMCGPIKAHIDKMERNLDALQRKRSQLAGGGSSERDRQRILASLEANDCRDKIVVERQPGRERNGTFFDRLFGGTGRVEPLEERLDAGIGRVLEPNPDDYRRHAARQPLGSANITRILNPDGSEASIGGPPGEFATMCVRTCDGYFFPMSPRSSSADFDRDLKNCESACPGADLQLFYQQSVGEESETMVSTATGEPYASLSTAYLYRDGALSLPQGCGCNADAQATGFSILAGETMQDEAPAEPVIPKPAARPDPGTDPETLANADGGLDTETIRRILKPKRAPAPTAAGGERRIRVVGPVFLPDPAAAIDLKAQAQMEVR
jgi:hypothetical protein